MVTALARSLSATLEMPRKKQKSDWCTPPLGLPGSQVPSGPCGMVFSAFSREVQEFTHAEGGRAVTMSAEVRPPSTGGTPWKRPQSSCAEEMYQLRQLGLVTIWDIATNAAAFTSRARQ